MADLTLTNLALWNALAVTDPSIKPPLVKLAEAELPAVAAWALRKTLRKAIEEFKDVDAARQTLVVEFAQKDADGKPVPSDDGKGVVLERVAEFAVELDKLMKQEVTLAGCRKVTLAELGDVKLSASTLDACDAFLSEE